MKWPFRYTVPLARLDVNGLQVPGIVSSSREATRPVIRVYLRRHGNLTWRADQPRARVLTLSVVTDIWRRQHAAVRGTASFTRGSAWYGRRSLLFHHVVAVCSLMRGHRLHRFAFFRPRWVFALITVSTSGFETYHLFSFTWNQSALSYYKWISYYFIIHMKR